jgi:hypothetical protein
MSFDRATMNRIREREEQAERRARWITEPGRHAVNIIGFSYVPPGTRRGIEFQLENDAGQQQLVRFGLLTSALYGPELSTFHAAAEGITDPAMYFPSLQLAKSKILRKLVGKRLIIQVGRMADGLHRVCSWAPVARPVSPSDQEVSHEAT